MFSFLSPFLPSPLPGISAPPPRPANRPLTSKLFRVISVTAGVVGAGWLGIKYAKGKLEEMAERVGEERRGKENLSHRFLQNQSDCSFTILALLPSISSKILSSQEDKDGAMMDVEGLTNKLMELKTRKDLAILEEDAKEEAKKLEKTSIEMEKDTEEKKDKELLGKEEKEGENHFEGGNGEDVHHDEQPTESVPNGNGDDEASGSVSAGATTALTVDLNAPRQEGNEEEENPNLPSSNDDGKEELSPNSDALADRDDPATIEDVPTSGSGGDDFKTEVDSTNNNDELQVPTVSDSQVVEEESSGSLNGYNLLSSDPPLDPTEDGSNEHQPHSQPEPESHSEPTHLSAPMSPLSRIPSTSSTSSGATARPNSNDNEETTEKENRIIDESWATINVPPPNLGMVLTPSQLEREKSDGAKGKEVEKVTDVAGGIGLEGSGPWDGKTRGQLWNELKIISISRTLTSLYTLTLLTLQTHIQLNLLGRYNYLDSVYELASPSNPSSPYSNNLFADGFDQDGEYDDDGSFPTFNAVKGEEGFWERRGGRWKEPRPKSKSRTGPGVGGKGISRKTERRYLTFSWWLLNEGWREIAGRTRESVEGVFGSVSLKATVSYTEISDLIKETRRKIEFDEERSQPRSLASSLFPATSTLQLRTLLEGGTVPNECVLDPELQQIIDETQDFLDSPDYLLVQKACLDKVFELFLTEIEPAFKPTLEKEAEKLLHPRLQSGRFEEVGEKTTRLASLLPVVARQSQPILDGLTNEYVEALRDVPELLEFSAVIYSSFPLTS